MGDPFSPGTGAGFCHPVAPSAPCVEASLGPGSQGGGVRERESVLHPSLIHSFFLSPLQCPVGH